MAREGGRSPWGKIQWCRELAPGAFGVSTAGHGGIKLDRSLNATVPASARQPGGWYEEDCNWAIAAYVVRGVEDYICGPRPAGREAIVDCLKRWQSDEVLVALGVTK